MTDLNFDMYNPLICAILTDRDSVLDKIMKDITKIHPYAITPPSTDKGRWQTFYKDKDGKRKNIKAPTKELLLKKLIEIYSTDTHIYNLTFQELFEEWIEYKSTLTNSPNTIKRYKQLFAKYFLENKLNSMKLKSIDEITLELICNNIVKQLNLTRKAWGNAKTILKGMFEFALRKKYISSNPLTNIRITIKFKQVVKKTGKTQTYNTEELKALNEYLDKMYSETSDTVFLAVKLNFLLGLRVGELVALKWEDMENIQLHVVREEVRDQTTNTYEVVEHTKTHTDRFVLIPSKALEILKKIEPTGE